MPTPYRHSKTGIFWIKGANPPDVATLTGRKQYRRSLRVRDPDQVKAAMGRVLLALEAEWRMARQAPQTLTMRQRIALAGEAYGDWMARHGDDPPPARVMDCVAAVLDAAAAARPAPFLLATDLPARIKAKGIGSVHEASLEAANRDTLAALAQAARQLGRHAQGNFSPDPEASRFPEWPNAATNSTPPAFTFADAIQLWAKDRQPDADTVSDVTSQWERMAAFLGHSDAAKLTADDVRRWRDHLRDDGTTGRGTIRDKYLALMKAVLTVAVSEGRLPVNVAANVKITVPKGSKGSPKRAFTSEEAQTILRATHGPHSRKLAASHMAARRWVPWLAAYTGARIAEMCQLRREDVTVIDGIPVVRITPEAGSTKSGQPRTVPLHPHLLEQGFLAFVQGHRPGPMFYDGKLASEGGKGHKTRSEDLAQWVRSLGVSAADVQPNHGWRHTFKSIARGMRPRMDAEIADYIQGHAPRTVGESYGHIPLPAIRDEVDRFPRFPAEPPQEALGSLQTAKGRKRTLHCARP